MLTARPAPLQPNAAGPTGWNCADLIVGGTASLALVRQVKAETGLPVRALLRPRFGDFCYDRYELAQMEQLAAELVAAGADGIVDRCPDTEGMWTQRRCGPSMPLPAVPRGRPDARQLARCTAP